MILSIWALPLSVLLSRPFLFATQEFIFPFKPTPKSLIYALLWKKQHSDSQSGPAPTTSTPYRMDVLCRVMPEAVGIIGISARVRQRWA